MEINKVYCGDCIDVMKTFPDQSVDLILTDPPYGVGLEYESFEDTKENLKLLIDAFMPEALRVAPVVLLTPGNENQYLYPKPDWTLAWVVPAGTGRNKWGFTCWHPILAYGKNPFLAKGLGSQPDIVMYNPKKEKCIDYGHPCSKPIRSWEDILKKGSPREGELVLDPFAGSGTTAIACLNLNRRYILIEKEPKYIDIIEKRIRERNDSESWLD